MAVFIRSILVNNVEKYNIDGVSLVLKDLTVSIKCDINQEAGELFARYFETKTFSIDTLKR